MSLVALHVVVSIPNSKDTDGRAGAVRPLQEVPFLPPSNAGLHLCFGSVSLHGQAYEK